ncbi:MULTISPECIES: hypothetical protein [unclassified Fusibacter]|uniref:hypothetical protein n=1 Tax=unclassified Fusibacter TaxID=2624464 RepID=UPI001011AAA6|nr:MULTISPECIES: hypothetical protein [unclassified Fusibacter]MCK8058426.1 hypothetical protein [Fusibacter sp. A2]NPE22806.1 hypothetical protein [Fusibacter sp. A1]RXV60362.1 hypothetical protein DWB64_13250 [Fusibacter sp. A1]
MDNGKRSIFLVLKEVLIGLLLVAVVAWIGIADYTDLLADEQQELTAESVKPISAVATNSKEISRTYSNFDGDTFILERIIDVDQVIEIPEGSIRILSLGYSEEIAVIKFEDILDKSYANMFPSIEIKDDKGNIGQMMGMHSFADSIIHDGEIIFDQWQIDTKSISISIPDYRISELKEVGKLVEDTLTIEYQGHVFELVREGNSVRLTCEEEIYASDFPDFMSYDGQEWNRLHSDKYMLDRIIISSFELKKLLGDLPDTFTNADYEMVKEYAKNVKNADVDIS